MLLPTPKLDEVLRFQAVYKAQYGIELPAREALPLLTSLVQFYYLTGGYEARRQLLEQSLLTSSPLSTRDLPTPNTPAPNTPTP